ncbi:BTAD domain-containing putative transcriptional regulator [Nonomuraea sp. NPDC048901]|uniref:AfsR/SARP family transcriptional regulator n=1 Tax=Nonomuraea sp. NPDC048901 TaxID=3155627 RepID=UPI0033CCD5B3
MASSLGFHILGPLEVIANNARFTITGLRQRTVLAVLLLTPDRVVSVDRLVEAVWSGTPPTTCRNQIAICVAGLRKVFQEAGCHEDVIVTAAPGYMLVSGDHRIDTVEFTARVESARQLAQDHRQLAQGQRQQGERHLARDQRTAQAASLLREALSLRRGTPFADTSSSRLQEEANLLEQQWLNAYEQYAELQLELERYSEIVSELSGLVQEQPLREHARAILMLANYRLGRRSEALGLFRQARQNSVDELGLEPGKELQELHAAMLREDPSLLSTSTASASTASTSTASASLNADLPGGSGEARLPADVPSFVSREEELASLDALLEGGPDVGSAAVGLITGGPGVGKSALAVRWAHRVAQSFPDGRFFADLTRPGDGEESVSVMLARFLRALKTPENEIPVDPRGRAELFQRSVAGRRVLVVLRGVRDLRRVQSLIPASETCCVLATSPHNHADNHPGPVQVRLRLDALDTRSAVELLDALVADHRVRWEPAAARKVVRYCDNLPLAVSAAAARLTAKAHWSVSHLLARLRDPLHRLDELSHGGPPGIRDSFDRGYSGLGPDAAALYRRLSLWDTPELDVWSGAALMNIDLSSAENLMEQLADAALLETWGRRPDGLFRYRLPSLLALHAREYADFHDLSAAGLKLPYPSAI